jgi:hypothetical protein
VSWYRHDANVWLPDQQTALNREWAAEKFWPADYASLAALVSRVKRGLEDDEEDEQQQQQQERDWETLKGAFGTVFGVEWVRSLVIGWMRARALEAAHLGVGQGKRICGTMRRHMRLAQVLAIESQ